jgi:hypothetical protein
LTIFLALTLVAGVAFAAWAPTTTDYTGAISTVRRDLATWTTGDNSSSIGRATIVLLVKADRRLAKAASRIGTGAAWKQVSRSMSALEEAVYLIQQSARLERRNSDYQSFATDSASSLYDEARSLTLDAANYVQTNHSSKRSTRKLLKAGARVTKAVRKATAERPRYYKAIRLLNKAIIRLGRAGLL